MSTHAPDPEHTNAQRGARSTARGGARVMYFVVCNTLLALFALEVGTRVVQGLRARSTDGSATSPGDVPYSVHPFFQTIYPPEADTVRAPFLAGWRTEPPELASTTEAASTPNAAAAPQATADKPLKLLFLGGSTTATLYPTYVREKLVQGLGPTKIYNLGYDWHCSLHSLYKLWTYGAGIAPDLVIVLENVNDFYRGFTPPETSLPDYRHDYSHHAGGLHPFLVRGKSRYDGRPVFYARPASAFARYEAHDESFGGLWSSLSNESSLLRVVRARFSEPPTPEVDIVTMPPEVYLRALPDFERNMRNIALACKVRGVPVLFLTMPFTTHGTHSFLPPGNFFTNDGVHHLAAEDFERGMRAFNAGVGALADEPQAFVFDLAKHIDKPEQFVDEVHLTDEAVQREGALVARYILERRLLTRPKLEPVR